MLLTTRAVQGVVKEFAPLSYGLQTCTTDITQQPKVAVHATT